MVVAQSVIEYGCRKFPDMKNRSLVCLLENPYLDTKGVKSIDKQIITSFPTATVDKDRFFRLAWLQYMSHDRDLAINGCSIEKVADTWAVYRWKGGCGPRRAYQIFPRSFPTEFHAVVAACLIFANQEVPGDEK